MVASSGVARAFRKPIWAFGTSKVRTSWPTPVLIRTAIGVSAFRFTVKTSPVFWKRLVGSAAPNLPPPLKLEAGKQVVAFFLNYQARAISTHDAVTIHSIKIVPQKYQRTGRLVLFLLKNLKFSSTPLILSKNFGKIVPLL
jgi:hypothetical protein